MVAVLLDFVKSPWNDEIALQHFFFLLAAVQEFYFYFICAACNFFLLTRACRKLFFEIIHTPPQELNGRPLRDRYWEQFQNTRPLHLGLHVV